jgi:membrane protease YdiL (CAAX protease family)
MKKLAAVLEVLTVKGGIFFAIWAFRLTPVWTWQRDLLGYEFFNNGLFFFVPLILLLLKRCDLAAYGLSFKNFRYQLVTALICLIPVGLANMVFSYVNKTTLSGSMILAADHIVLLLVFALLLRKRSLKVNIAALCVFPLFMFANVNGLGAATVQKVLTVVYFLFFVGFGEEMLNRGYIQSRLNGVFGRHWSFFGVKVGWGLVITSLIFGFGHVFTNFNPFLGEFNWNWWQAFWTIFSGLVFGYLRERTGSILVPAIIHGLPLTIAYLFFIDV